MLRQPKTAWAAPLWAVTFACLLNGCGGGGTGSYTNGPISGLGSIIVNGVRYDVDDAILVADDKDAGTGSLPSTNDLLVGMTVEVEGSAVTAVSNGPGQATATRVRYAAELIGELNGLTSASGRPTSFTVLGQRVNVNASTVLPDAALSDGQVVVVHGLPTLGGGVTATRVDAVTAPPFYKLSGEVQSINRTTRIITFRPGAVQVRYALSLAPPASVVTGSLLRARVLPSNDLANLQAVQLSPRETAAPGEREVRLEGRLSGYNVTGTTVTGFIGRTPVDLSAIFGAQSLANDVLIEVKGRLRNGVLVAEELELEDEQTTREAELYGAPSGHDAANKTFVLRGLTIEYGNVGVDAGVTFNDPCLRVRGEAISATRVRATEVKRDSDCR